MGADARWVCHTCKTVCSRGGRPYVKHGRVVDVAGIQQLKAELAMTIEDFEINNEDSMVSFLNDLQNWLVRHESHSIHIGSDYSTDMMDLDDYKDETVNGKVSKFTRHEVNLSCYNEWFESSVSDVESTINDCIKGKRTPRDAAIELVNRFQVETP